MAIQITENKLSLKARKALNNAKNKSQLLRDALEYYVNREEVISIKNNNESSEHVEYFKKEVQELKNLIQELHLHSDNKVIEKKEFEQVESEIKSQNQDSDFAETIIQSDKMKENTHDDNLPSEEKKRIEEMIANSLDMFS